MPAPAEVQAATLEKFIEGWKGWTPEGFLTSFADNCTQITLPFRNGDGKPKTKAELVGLFPILMSTLSNFKLTIHNVVHDPSQGKATIYAIGEAETPFIPYHNESAVFLWFDESGQKVEKIEEMFDSAFMEDFLPKFQGYWAENMKEQAQ